MAALTTVASKVLLAVLSRDLRKHPVRQGSPNLRFAVRSYYFAQLMRDADLVI